MRALLDINVLLALQDADHLDHRRAHGRLDREIAGVRASCPITESGFVRVVSQPRYPSPVPPSEAVALPSEAGDDEHHEHWPCGINLLGAGTVRRSHVHGPRQASDAHLVAPAAAHGGRSTTFDRSGARDAVPGATRAHLSVL